MKAFKKMALFYRPEPPRGSYEIGEFVGQTIEISTLSSTSIGGVCSFTNFQVVFSSNQVVGGIAVGDFLFQDADAQILFPSGGTFVVPRYYLVRLNNTSPSFVAGMVANQIISLQPCDSLDINVKYDVSNQASGWIINSVTPVYYIEGGFSFPLSNGQIMTGVTTTFKSASIAVNVEKISGANAELVLLKNLSVIQTISVTATGVYTFAPISAEEGDNILIELNIPI